MQQLINTLESELEQCLTAQNEADSMAALRYENGRMNGLLLALETAKQLMNQTRAGQ